jgi:hypothetical protein
VNVLKRTDSLDHDTCRQDNIMLKDDTVKSQFQKAPPESDHDRVCSIVRLQF